MTSFKIKIKERDSDVYIYNDVSTLEIKDGKILVEYKVGQHAAHLLNCTDEITIKTDHQED